MLKFSTTQLLLERMCIKIEFIFESKFNLESIHFNPSTLNLYKISKLRPMSVNCLKHSFKADFKKNYDQS